MSMQAEKRAPTREDMLIGENILKFRTMLSMSQGELGGYVGVSFQQIQKYENGKGRISAGRLARIARVMGLPVARFFDGTEAAPHG